MRYKDYDLWTVVTPEGGDKSYENLNIENPLLHLKQNYQNIKSPIGFSGITNIYRYYGGQLSYKQIKDFLAGVDTYTLHKKSRETSHNPTFVKYRRQQLQLDLVDIQKLSKLNDNYRFLLNGIDCFTRFGFCAPLKDKRAPTVLEGFKAILRTARDYPSTLVTDSGSEFINWQFVNFCKDNSIKCYQSYTSTHAAFVERYNRTIKNKIYAYMDGQNTERFVDVLPDIINSYNNSHHRIIGMTPSNAELKENQLKVRQKMELYYAKVRKKKPKYKIGDNVRISTMPSKFQRGFEIQNASEIFVVSSINTNLPLPLYKIHTYGKPEDVIKGSFYESELTLTKLDHFQIENILRKTKNKVLVKWQGYSEPTWEPRRYIESILKGKKIHSI